MSDLAWSWKNLPILVFIVSWFEQILLAEDHSSLVSDLVIMTLPETRKLAERRFCLPYPGCKMGGNDLSRHWNINQFPIRTTLLRLFLGPANSRLTTHCRETLPFRSPRFSPGYAVTATRICTSRSVHWISQPSFYPITTPTYHTPTLLVI